MARFVRANGLTFAVTTAGPVDGPLALCLHGFPDTPATWRHLVPVLTDAGYRVTAPYLRGYAPTEVPPDRRIDPDTLTADVNALHRALGGGPDAVLIGHDWGAVAAARAAAAAPERWRRLVTLAVPPERFLVDVLHPRQLLRSGYQLRAQLPGAERWLIRDDLATVRRLWRRWSPGYAMTPDDLDPLRACLRSPGVPTAVLGYYRGFLSAMLRGRALGPAVPLPPQPHLHLHGEDDGCVDIVAATRAAGHLAHSTSRVEALAGVGHFLHLEEPDRVADAIVGFLGGTGR